MDEQGGVSTRFPCRHPAGDRAAFRECPRSRGSFSPTHRELDTHVGPNLPLRPDRVVCFRARGLSRLQGVSQWSLKPLPSDDI